MTPEMELRLMQYLDGELSALEAARVRRHLAADPELARVERRSRVLRDEVRSWAQTCVPPSDDLADLIIGSVEREGMRPSRLRSRGAALAPQPPHWRAIEPTRIPLARRARWLEPHDAPSAKGVGWSAAGVLVAAAAFVLLVGEAGMRREHAQSGPPVARAGAPRAWVGPPPPVGRAAVGHEERAAVARTAADRLEAPLPPGVEVGDDVSAVAAIERVDFGTGEGSIFLVGLEGRATPVVWMLDEPALTVGRAEAL